MFFVKIGFKNGFIYEFFQAKGLKTGLLTDVKMVTPVSFPKQQSSYIVANG